MITIKLPYKTDNEAIKEIKNLQQQFSIVVRFSFKRLKEFFQALERKYSPHL